MFINYICIYVIFINNLYKFIIKMVQYFQLTQNILLEYIYEGDPKFDVDGNKGNKKNIYGDTPTILLNSDILSSKYLCFKDDSEGIEGFSNLVLPLNNTETQFVIAKSNNQNFFSRTNVSNRFLSKNGNGQLYVDTNYDKNINQRCDVSYDKCVVHFTSGNYFENYDSLIFQAYAYMNNKSKLYFASFLFRKTSNLDITPEQMLYNGKLYTTQIEFEIPSAFSILSKDNLFYNEDFNNALKSQNIELLENSPIGINLYGVSGSTIGTDNYERLKTIKINSISIPYVYNRLDEIQIDINEASDGDYFYIDPKMTSGYSSFVDYIETMGEDIRAYMVMHELSLRESWVDSDNKQHSVITHTEYHIIEINEDDEDEYISSRFDAKIKYRPICMYGGLNYRAIIIDTIKLINTVDSSSYEVTGSVEILNPNKYGKKIKKLDFNNELRPIVNVYNNNKSSINNSSSGISGSISGVSGSVSGGVSLSKTIGTLSGTFTILNSGSGSDNGDSDQNGSGSGSDSDNGDSDQNGSGSGSDSDSDNGDSDQNGSDNGDSDQNGSDSDNGDSDQNGSGSGSDSDSDNGDSDQNGSDNGDSDQNGSGSDNGGTILGNLYGNVSIVGSIQGSVSGFVNSSGNLSGNISIPLPGLGSFISGTFSNSSPGIISGTISGYISKIGHVTGTVTGSYSNDSGSMSCSIINPNTNISSSNTSNSEASDVIVINKGGGFVVENMTQNITSFIESINVGVSIVELSPDDIY